MAVDAVHNNSIEKVEATGSPDPEVPQQARRLSTIEIRETFSGVRDDAIVQDSAGTRAVNYWYADGRFTNQWSNRGGSGKVTGQWWADKDQRCILIQSGLPDRIGKQACAPVYRHGSEYLSLNPDGSIHGRHTLSPILSPAARTGVEYN
jgi:hypothetical protein